MLATITLTYMEDGESKSGGETRAYAAGPHGDCLATFRMGDMKRLSDNGASSISGPTQVSFRY